MTASRSEVKFGRTFDLVVHSETDRRCKILCTEIRIPRTTHSDAGLCEEGHSHGESTIPDSLKCVNMSIHAESQRCS